MKLSKGKLPKIIRQKKQSMKKRKLIKSRGGKNNKSFRKKQKPLNLHKSSVKKIYILV